MDANQLLQEQQEQIRRLLDLCEKQDKLLKEQMELIDHQQKSLRTYVALTGTTEPKTTH